MSLRNTNSQKGRRASYALAMISKKPLNSLPDKRAVTELITDLLHLSATLKVDSQQVVAEAQRAFHNDRANELKIWEGFNAE